MSISRRGVCVGAAVWLAAGPLAAGDAPAVLTVTGAGAQVAFSRADLSALPQRRLSTANEFIDGVGVFVGPLARDVLAAAVAAAPDATEAVMVAVNDYEVVIPLSDFVDYDVVFATSMNGRPLTRRDKGPVWVMYPIDDHAELATPLYDNRLIWQLKAVTLR